MLVLGYGRASADPTKPFAIELKVVNYDQLVEAVKAHRGKVVVIDLWGDFCPPCKKAFPHLVEMHKKYAAEGLVCISLCIPTSDSELMKDHPKALKFLTEQKATFQNYLLEDGWKVCDAKFNINGVPAAYVFDRAGLRARKFDPSKPYEMEDVEKLVIDLLRPKK